MDRIRPIDGIDAIDGSGPGQSDRAPIIPGAPAPLGCSFSHRAADHRIGF